MKTIDRVKAILPSHKFDVTYIAEELGFECRCDNGLYRKQPYIATILLKLCKEGVLYQWIIGTGGGLNGMTYKSHTYEVCYLKRDSELAEKLLSNPNRKLKGHRIY